MNGEAFRLRRLGAGARLGIGFVVLTILGGLAASGAQVFLHHHNKDEQPELSMDDIKGGYHGVQSQARMLKALQNGHPPTLAQPQRDTLLKWLRGTRIAEDYDSLDLGDAAPVEIISHSCLDCHGQKNADHSPIAKTVPLDSWNDVKKVAFSKDLSPPGMDILITTTHTHALSLGSLTLVVMGLMLATSWPRRLVRGSVGIVGVALFLDLGAWWLSRVSEAAVYLIVGAGTVYNGVLALMLLAVLVDLCRPGLGQNRRD
jgi:hypothetical protein